MYHLDLFSGAQQGDREKDTQGVIRNKMWFPVYCLRFSNFGIPAKNYFVRVRLICFYSLTL